MKGDMISGVVVITIIIASGILVLNTINPVIEETKDFQKFNEAKKVMGEIDTAVSEILFEAPGARRSIDIKVPGKLSVAGGEDKIKMTIEGTDIFASGVRSQEGNLEVSSGASMKAQEKDIDGDGNMDLVLENGLALFAVKKLGSPASQVTINTTTFITMLKNKRANINITNPRSGIFVDDKETTSYGVGYTELTKQGSNLASAGIHIFVNATAANVTYDATFTLKSSLDFVSLEVSKVTGV